MNQKISGKKKYISIVLLIYLCFCQLDSVLINVVSATEYTESTVAVQEIDLGDYQSQMTVGERQLLSITVLPVDATNQEVIYSSSNTKVAKVNSMGRITALKDGVTEIVVSCGGISEKFVLTVVDVQIIVRDLDLGDYPSELEVGTSQLLSITVIPENAFGQKITYTSSDTGIATVNELGRITGIKEGTVTITVNCGNVKKDFQLKVVKAKSDEIPVTDIEIADHEDELEVDKTLTLSVTVLPSDATNNTVTYKSSDEKVATVNSSGEVKGIAEGDVTISITAGSVTKKVKLKVKVATTSIKLDTTYLILQLGESYQLTAKVLPAEADQALTYESITPEIISVTSGGMIRANKCGTGTILVKNSDTSTAVTVIVNSVGNAESDEIEQSLQEKEQEYENTVFAEGCPVITTDMLRYFYEQNEILTVYGNGYTIKIDGKKIENWDNELYTKLEFVKEERGISFELNRSKRMCGEVTIQFDEDTLSGKYVYLYNKSKGKYELLQEKDITLMELDTEGKYLVTEKKLSSGRISLVAFIVAVVFVVILLVVYIATKKRYWFW